MRFKQKIYYKNSFDESIKLIIEPWAHELWVDSNAEIVIQVEGDSEYGCLMIESTQKAVIVYGWPGCIIDIYQDNEKIF